MQKIGRMSDCGLIQKKVWSSCLVMFGQSMFCQSMFGHHVQEYFHICGLKCPLESHLKVSLSNPEVICIFFQASPTDGGAGLEVWSSGATGTEDRHLYIAAEYERLLEGAESMALRKKCIDGSIRDFDRAVRTQFDCECKYNGISSYLITLPII